MRPSGPNLRQDKYMSARLAFAALLASCLALPSAHADEASVRQALQARFPNMAVESVTRAPFAGLYEVVLDGEIVYTDDKVEYFFAGSIYDIRTLPSRAHAIRRSSA